MRISIGELRRVLREEIYNSMIGYPFGGAMPMPEEPAGSMPPIVDRDVPPAGDGYEEPEDVDGLDLSIFDDAEDLFMPVLRDPYARDTLRLGRRGAF